MRYIRFNQLHSLGTAYFTENTFKKIEGSIEFFEKLESERFADEDSEWLQQHVRIEAEKKDEKTEILSKLGELKRNLSKRKE